MILILILIEWIRQIGQIGLGQSDYDCD